MIGVFGPALIDEIKFIEKFPELGGHAVVKKVKKVPGGAGANVACALSRFGIKTRFFSSIGKDENGKLFIESMLNFRVDCRLNFVDLPTGIVEVFVDSNGERTFFVHPNASAILNFKVKDDEMSDLSAIYLDPYPSEDSFNFHLKLAKKAKKVGKKVILNPGYPYSSMGFKKIEKLLKFCDIVIMSEYEYNLLKNNNKNNNKIFEVVDIVAITRGEMGSKAYYKGKWYEAKAFKVKVVDTTGAGDAFAAAFIYGIERKLNIDHCLKLGNFSASYNIQRIGARNFPSKDEIEKFITNLQK